MPSDAPLASRSAVAARLRAAGCVYAEDEADLLIAAARHACRPGRHGRPAGRGPAARARAGLGGVPRPADQRGSRRVRPPAPHRVPGRPGHRAGPAGGRGRGPVLRLGRPGRRARRRRGPGPRCTPPTSTRPRCAAPGATSRPPAGGSTRATCTGRCPPRCAGGWTSCWPTCRTCPRARSPCSRRKRATTRPGWPWMAGPTAWACCGGSPRARLRGWHRAAICCPRSASARWPRPPRRPPAPGWPPGWTSPEHGATVLVATRPVSG